MQGYRDARGYSRECASIFLIAFGFISCAGRPSIDSNNIPSPSGLGEYRALKTPKNQLSPKRTSAVFPERHTKWADTQKNIKLEKDSVSPHPIYNFLDKLLHQASAQERVVEVVFVDQLTSERNSELSSMILACGVASTKVQQPRSFVRGTTFETLAYNDRNRDGSLLDASEQTLLENCKKNFESCKIKFSAGEWFRWSTWGNSRRSQRDLALRGSSLGMADNFNNASRFLEEVIHARIRLFENRGVVLSYENSTFRAQGLSDRFELAIDSLQHSIFDFLLLGARKHRNSEIYVHRLDLWPGKHKPVTGVFVRRHYDIGERVGGWTILQRYQDIGVYSNHYFDFWFRALFLIEKQQKRFGVVCSVLDIDEVKGSGIKRFVFGKDLKESIERALHDELLARF